MSNVTEIRKPTLKAWREHVRYSTMGKKPNEYQVIKPTLQNLIDTFRYHPDWVGALAYDEFTDAPELTRDAIRSDLQIQPGTWTSEYVSHVSAWLASIDIVCSDTRRIEEAMMAAAAVNRHHPVKDFLRGLSWDGAPRLDTWLIDCGEAEDDIYTRAVSSKWKISCVARIMQPGCKADCMLVLRGKQGAKKSTAFSVLGGKWFVDTPIDFGSKDSFEVIRKAWIYEAAELSSLSKRDASSIKAFMSSRLDTYRPPYGRKALEFKRHVVLCGSVNQDTYLKDETGNRRFWDVPVGRFDLERLARDRDQLWAEAVHRYNAGESWWLDTQELEEMAAEHQLLVTVSDDWEHTLADWATPRLNDFIRTGVTTHALLTIALDIEPGDVSPADSTRVGIAMARLGWTRRQVRENDRRVWKLFPPPKSPGTTEELFPIGPE